MSKNLSLNSSVLTTSVSILPVCPPSLPAGDAVPLAVSPHLMSRDVNRAAFRSSPVPVAVERKLFLSHGWLLGKGWRGDGFGEGCL